MHSDPQYHGESQTEEAFIKSLERLELDYIDLFLIHFPGTAKFNVKDSMNKQMRQETWEKLVEIYDDGKAKAIGVSNYTTKHLQELMTHYHSVTPAVNQVSCLNSKIVFLLLSSSN